MSDWIGWSLAALLGAAAAWLLAERRGRARIEDARVRTGELERRLTEERTRLEGEQRRLAEREEELRAERGRTTALEAERRVLETSAAELGERLEQERRAAAEKIALLDRAQQALSDSFKALSAEALKSNNEAFLQLAKGSFEKLKEGASGDLALRQRAVDELVKPIRDSLAQVDLKLGEMERKRIGAYSALDEQLKSLVNDHLPRLHDETANLVKALRRPEARGRWGEMQLKRVVEMAGMQEHCDFEEQVSVAGGEKNQRPDMIVHLPGGRRIVVDAKAPLDAYMNAMTTTDEEERRRFLVDHARQLRVQIEHLSRKDYLAQFDPTPEFVVLFVPGEAFFSAALIEEPGLIDYGTERRVIPASPTTLIALLKAVAYGWRQESMAKNAQQIADLGRDLHKRVGKLGEHWAKVGSQLDKAVEAYNRSVGTLERQVLPQARKFRELGVTGGEEIPEIAPIEKQVRELNAPELQGGDSSAGLDDANEDGDEGQV